MILKGLKRNALKKSVESSLKKRKPSNKQIQGIKSLAVLIDASQSVDILSVIKLSNALGVKTDKLTILGYKEDQKDIENDKNAAYYNDKSFSVNGGVKSNSLKEFINKDFDILINFYQEDKLELNYVAAASQANFKIGYAATDHRINDLIIGSSGGSTDVFISELKKYLKILQIL